MDIPQNATTSLLQILRDAITKAPDWQGLLILAAVAATTLIPLTLIRRAFCFSVGYGAAIATTTLTMWMAFAPQDVCPQLLMLASLLYGVRLSLFLLIRLFTVRSMANQTKSFDEKTSIPISIVMCLCLGSLYTCMVSPVFFVISRATPLSTVPLVTWLGAAMAYAGWLGEAVADLHKFLVKRRHKVGFDEKRFVGPTQGLYRLCQHPNFFSEVLFWTGLWLAGIPYYDHLAAWVCTTCGWLSIGTIMNGSAKRLDKKHERLYGKDDAYLQWTKSVPGSLFPVWWH